MPSKSQIEQLMSERRNGIRAARVVAIQHRLIKNPSKKCDVQWSLSTTKNMSISGLLFLSEIPYVKGDILELDVVMSGMIEIYKGFAEVVRVHESSSKAFDIAVKYVEFKPAARAAKSHLK